MSPLLPETLLPAAFQPPLLALVASLVLALAAGAAGQRRLAGAGAAAGLALALFLVFGVRMVTPRMLPERLPWLVSAAGLLGLVGDLMRLRGVASGLLAAIGGGAAAWFMLGAPRMAPDLSRVALEAAPVLLAFAVPLWRLVPDRAAASGPARVLAGAVLAASGLWLGGSAGVFVGLAALAGAASSGLLLAMPMLRGSAMGLAGAFGLAAGLGGAVAAAGLALRLPAVWAGAAAPLLGLAAGPAVAAALGLWRGTALGEGVAALLAGLPLVGAAWGLAAMR